MSMESQFYKAAEQTLMTYRPYVTGGNYDSTVSTAQEMLLSSRGNCFAFAEAVGGAMRENSETRNVIITLSSVFSERRRALHAACTAISHQNESLCIDFYDNALGNKPEVDNDALLLHNHVRPGRVVYAWTRRGSNVIRSAVRKHETMSKYRWPNNALQQRIYISTTLPHYQ